MKGIATIIAAALLLPLTAQAQDLSYSYIEADYVRLDPDGAGSENGFALRGSAAINENFHVFADYLNTDIGAFDVDGYSLGFGYNTRISENTDFVGRLGYERIDIGIADEDGFSAEIGLRAALGPSFEGLAAIRYVDFDDSDTSLVLGGQYKFNASWGVNAELDFNDDGNSFLIGPRLSF